MPEYVLRNVDPELWSRFIERAKREGWPTRALIVELLEEYARGDVSPRSPAPKAMPEWSWLREYYNDVAQFPPFATLNVDEQWQALTQSLLASKAAMAHDRLDQVPPEHRADILNWLKATSAIETKHLLTLRAIASFSKGPDLRGERYVFQYEVLGLPPNQEAWIADMNGGWRILRVIDGRQGKWSDGPHKTKEAAVAALAEQVNQPDPTLNQAP